LVEGITLGMVKTDKKIIFIFLAFTIAILIVGYNPVSAHTPARVTNSVFPSCATYGNDSDVDFICDDWEPATSTNLNEDMSITWRPSGWPTGAPNYRYDCGADDPGFDPVCPRKDQRDIFIEVDCISGQCPSNNAITKMKDAFTAQGIALHVQVDESLVATDHNSSPTTGTRWPGSGTTTLAGFDQIKRGHFGTPTERQAAGGTGDSNWLSAVWKQKQQVFHYTLFAKYRFGATTSSGIAELGGNDIMITLGSWTGGVGSVEEQAGTFMHELGHNLNFKHGGDDDVNCKPLYLSVMSYSRQMGDLVPTRDVDFSQDALGVVGTADSQPEGAVIETDSVEGYLSGSEQFTYGPTPPVPLPQATGGQYNWDPADGIVGTSKTIAGLNSLTGCTNNVVEDVGGFDDWAAIDYNFKDDADAVDGVSFTDLEGESCADDSSSSFVGSTECVREVTSGISEDGFTTTDGGWTTDADVGPMTIKVTGLVGGELYGGEITVEIAKDHRKVRYDAFYNELLSELKNAPRYDNTMDVIKQRIDNDFNNIALWHQGLTSLRTQVLRDNPDDMTLRDALDSLQESIRVASYDGLEDLPFSPGSLRQQESQGNAVNELSCQNEGELLVNTNHHRTGCFINDIPIANHPGWERAIP